MTAVLALTHEPSNWIAAAAVLGGMTAWIWWDHRPRRDERGK